MLKSFIYSGCISFFLLLFHFDTFGQKNFTPGYLILNSQDTVFGSIDNQNWDRNPRAIHFRKNKDDKIQKYTSKQIAEFGIIAGDIYRSAIVQVDKTPTEFEKLTVNLKPVIITDTVFLLKQVQGTISLYYLYDEKNKNHFFIQKGEEPIIELIQRNYLIYINQQPLLGTYNQYEDQLKNFYLTECPDVQPLIAKVTYTKAALKFLIEKYNKCINPKIAEEVKSTDKMEAKFGLIAGTNLTFYRIESEDNQYKYLNATKFDWQPNPVLGISFQLMLPRNRQKWSIYSELAWKRNFSQGHYSYFSTHSQQSGTVTIKARALAITSMVRYSWLYKNWQPYVNGGLAFNRDLKVSTHVQHKVVNSVSEQPSESYLFKNPDRFQIGGVAGAGIKMKKLMAEIRVEHGTSYFHHYNVIDTKRVLVFLLGYSFN